jgi:hypothetical protein
VEREGRGAEWRLLNAATRYCLDQTSDPAVEPMTGETEGEDLLAPDGHRRMRRRGRDRPPGTLMQRTSPGGVSEWSKETVLKTVGPDPGLVGSNPTPSARLSHGIENG